ncbi:hypothetical protein SUDANB19_06262 [Streptomyces sp. enrichment culture]
MNTASRTTDPVTSADGSPGALRHDAPALSAAAQARSAVLEERLVDDPRQFRVLTGDRPTGRLHLGHYFGTLLNRVRLQDLGVEMFVVVADYQVLTDRDIADDPTGYVEELVLDYLAVGLDPSRSTIFTHSSVPALNQLLLPFLSLVSVAELGRNPTVKDEIAHSRQSSVSGLMFTYPVHQAADILFCRPTSSRSARTSSLISRPRGPSPAASTTGTEPAPPCSPSPTPCCRARPSCSVRTAPR